MGHIYIKALQVYAKWWRSKCWQESGDHGTNEREHEILIRITRFSVVCSMAAFIDITTNAFDTASFYDDSHIIWIIASFIEPMYDLILVSSIYFTFEFGYAPYLKIYGKCHSWCYTKSLSAYKKVDVGYVQLKESV